MMKQLPRHQACVYVFAAGCSLCPKRNSIMCHFPVSVVWRRFSPCWVLHSRLHGHTKQLAGTATGLWPRVDEIVHTCRQPAAAAGLLPALSGLLLRGRAVGGWGGQSASQGQGAAWSTGNALRRPWGCTPSALRSRVEGWMQFENSAAPGFSYVGHWLCSCQ